MALYTTYFRASIAHQRDEADAWLSEHDNDGYL